MANEDVFSWDDYFMGVARLASKRSKNPKLQVGACVVDADKRIVGVGWNGAPTGIKDKDVPWGTSDQDRYECHAAMNALVMYDVKACKIYTTVFPCRNCAKIIIQAGIKRVVYSYDAKSEVLTCGDEGANIPAILEVFDKVAGEKIICRMSYERRRLFSDDGIEIIYAGIRKHVRCTIESWKPQ